MIAGAHFVAERAEPLNKINVFPVPDGDTGTNVASTLQKVAAGIARIRQRHVREMSPALADEAVGGARGNSGAILAQFFCGFSEGLPDAPRVSTRDFGDAVVRASESAYSAIARPVEGTILTVIRDWARYVADRAAEDAGLRRAPARVAEGARSVAGEHAQADEGPQEGGRRRRRRAGLRVSARGDRPYVREAARSRPPPVAAGGGPSRRSSTGRPSRSSSATAPRRCSKATRSTATRSGGRRRCSATRS